MDLERHPTIIAYRQMKRKTKPETVDKDWVKQIFLSAGADDAGVVEIDRPELADQLQAILEAFPKAKTLVSFICRMNQAQFRSADRSLADGEFIAFDAEMRLISRKVVRTLREESIEAITPSECFPQDMNKTPGKRLTVSHKPVAVAAGLGQMGHHRILIHPVFGSHLCLGTLILDTALDGYDRPLDYNPCISCNLCVDVCPTGAIRPDGTFKFMQCLVHAYHDRLGGFLSWVDALVTSSTMDEYRQKRDDSESMAVWQSLTYSGGYRCGYCMSVCPAGLDLIGSFLDHRREYINSVVKPLNERRETVYIPAGQEVDPAFVDRFPNKKVKQL